MSNPVRIYVLHHPESRFASGLTDHIYDWFRMPTLEGIPVYIRSHPQSNKKVPILPQGKSESLEYLIPLVDAYMVRDASWQDYILRLAKGCLGPTNRRSIGWVMFPVALDNSAFNMPDAEMRLAHAS